MIFIYFHTEEAKRKAIDVVQPEVEIIIGMRQDNNSFKIILKKWNIFRHELIKCVNWTLMAPAVNTVHQIER